MLVHSKRPSFSLQFGQKQNKQALIWKKSLLICFESYQGMVFPIPSHRQSRQRMLNTLLMVNINPICCLLIFILCKEKNRNLACISRKHVIFSLDPQLFCQQIEEKKKHPLVEWTSKCFFFHMCSYKNSSFGELAYNSSILVLI